MPSQHLHRHLAGRERRRARTPVPVEPDPPPTTLDPAAVAAAITPRTAAIMPVHLYGQPADMDALARTRRTRIGLAARRGRRAGARRAAAAASRPAAWATPPTLSFYPGKNLGALGDGGAVTTDDAALADAPAAAAQLRVSAEVRARRSQACNSRLDELQAAVLRVKLTALDEWNERRRADRRAATLPPRRHPRHPPGCARRRRAEPGTCSSVRHAGNATRCRGHARRRAASGTLSTTRCRPPPGAPTPGHRRGARPAHRRSRRRERPVAADRPAPERRGRSTT